MLKKLAVELEAIHEYMITDVSPQLLERWEQEVIFHPGAPGPAAS